MYCRYCGKKIDDGSNFCPYCGSAVNGNNFDGNAPARSDDPFSEFAASSAQSGNAYVPPVENNGGNNANQWYYNPSAATDNSYVPPQPLPKKESNGLSVAGLILSSCSVFFGIIGTAVPSSVFVSLGFLAIIGLVLSIVGTIKSAKTKVGRVPGIIGIILGAVGIILWVVCIWMFIVYLIIQVL